MGKLSFYVLWSLRDAPRQFMSKSNHRYFQVHVPLPLPKQLVIFGFGEWESSKTISVEVLVSANVQAQNIGTLSAHTRCLTWEGEWNHEIAAVATEKGMKGVYGKIVLTVCEEQDKDSVFSSTPLVHREWSFPQGHNQTHLSSTSHQSTMNETMTRNCAQLGDSVCYGEIQVNKIDTSDCNLTNRPPAWPTDKTPRRTIICKRGRLAWSSEDMDSPGEVSTPKKRILSRLNSQEEMAEQIKTEHREVSGCPSKRWCHTMCLIDPDTAVLIGGEASDQNYCKDSLWKLELDSDFWFPMNPSASGPVLLCARGQSATFDPDSKAVFVYGGLRDGLTYNELHVLNTVTWKWTHVNTKGNIPTLAYHSATFYKKELFVFGGVKPSNSSGAKNCSNALYIFNPEFGLWYQPIVEGEKPLPRFGHSATLLSNKLIIFGGRKTATYLSDLYILDLGMMEYAAVKCENMPPLPRGFHAALPVSDNRILVSGGCSAIGALQDIHIFNINTRMWSSLACPPFSSKPRAGHSIMGLGCTTTANTDQCEARPGPLTTQCKLLVFGGSDCSGNFYNDSVKCTVEVPCDD
uniref:Zgc:163014 n=1 Tax=Neogobius melanostomus TaxID=47308 RepID=A0A8C6T1N4_9GOBI